MGQVLPFGEPGGSRRRDPITSKLAAGKVNATQLELEVHAFLLQHDDMTALEIARGMPMDIRTVSPRLRPLARLGVVLQTGYRRCLNNAGNYSPMMTWRALP